MNLSHPQLDQIDIQILTHLQKDGRKSFTDISQEMNVSVGMIRNRYQKLVENKVLHIIGWTDPVKAGLNAYARINIKVRPTDIIQEVVEELTKIQEVSFLALTSGNYDIEINMTCINNKHLLDTINQKIHSINGIFETNTTMYLDVRKWASQDVSQDFSHLEVKNQGKEINKKK
ncbi:Lrp/AsnC family transcriptional regulator [Lutimonas zeaxanthinifaciens]|uniref:Lrp/AsnC family transcriptional regulator n=1 Tax=Lutimonas zeaxanthinifaciens TaxID=3060215 RepID=UPI00265CAC4A|nr:Lrp/AsnC family transcriptional regulator [Lutimonas sp. YSD2104]WKK65343.1 Lrp/AsnC family transcriptional regulator [Lutimonas sp. YSD2104]